MFEQHDNPFFKYMDSSKVDNFLLANGKFFESHDLPLIKERLLNLSDDKAIFVLSQEYKDPTMMLVISILAGGLGIDRFMIGDTGLGILKLITCGGLGIWALIDIFLIMGKTKKFNLNKVIQFSL